MNPPAEVVVVGNGASAIAMVVRLLELTGRRILWLGGLDIHNEMTGRAHSATAYGIAYGKCSDGLHLNVPAKSMSLPGHADDAHSFARFLVDGGRYPADEAPEVYALRSEYRAYLRWMLHGALGKTRSAGMERVAFLPRLGADDIGTYFGGRRRDTVLCMGVVLCPTPDVYRGSVNAAEWVGNPWRFDFERAAGAGRVLVIGSGLTAMDVAFRVWRRSPRTHVDFVSRHGRFPLRFESVSRLPEVSSLIGLSPRRLTAALRRLVKRDGFTVQEIFAAARSHWRHIWGAWDEGQRRRFLRHLRPHWEVNRHRMTPRAANELAAHPHRLWKSKAFLQRPANGETYEFVFNASGISTNPLDNPELAHLVQAGIVKTAALPGGPPHGLAADGDYRVGERIWCVGAYQRPQVWEATAMPDITQMVDSVARQIGGYGGLDRPDRIAASAP